MNTAVYLTDRNRLTHEEGGKEEGIYTEWEKFGWGWGKGGRGREGGRGRRGLFYQLLSNFHISLYLSPTRNPGHSTDNISSAEIQDRVQTILAV